jgi:hypothetical protein
MNGYNIVHAVLEARFNLTSSKKRRIEIAKLWQQYKQEKDFAKRRELLRIIQQKKNDLALRPNRAYSQYRDY